MHALDELSDILAPPRHLLDSEATLKEREFFASKAAGYIELPHIGGEYLPCPTEDLVAGCVTIAVVDRFEMVKIEENKCSRHALPAKELKFFQKGAPVQQAGQAILAGLQAKLLIGGCQFCQSIGGSGLRASNSFRLAEKHGRGGNGDRKRANDGHHQTGTGDFPAQHWNEGKRYSQRCEQGQKSGKE
ncbi:hypothetical protein J2T08_001265 [Neorhizobium galegae]|nr:hypothetical protein [Neorhizobium galegae]